MTDGEIRAFMRRQSRRSFLTAGAATLAGGAAWTWLLTRPAEDRLRWPLRRVLEWNGRLWSRSMRLTPEFALSSAAEPRPNGEEGLSGDVDPISYRLAVTSDSGPLASLALDGIKELPRVSMVTELKCIEGWSQIVQWAGARLSDFAKKVGAPSSRYVGLETPDRQYYVGLDIESARHAQTLLCYEMNGAPLTPEHGAPLRLVIPLKYGIKSIKRIGSIRFTDTRPRDFWAERGYDWHSGH